MAKFLILLSIVAIIALSSSIPTNETTASDAKTVNEPPAERSKDVNSNSTEKPQEAEPKANEAPKEDPIDKPPGNGTGNKEGENLTPQLRSQDKDEPAANVSLKTSNATDDDDKGWEFENTTAVDTRRILYSKETQPGKRPYMVYLQLTKESAKAHKYRGWLCGGVIVDPSYVLTSAACVEDAEHFYIVSGTTKFIDSMDYKENDCVCRNRRKVVWKCIPKNYKFDFQDSIKWSSNDIAIVKVDKPFKIGIKEKDCEFGTDIICYNNISRELEKPGTKGYIAGWGSGSNFREGVYRRAEDDDNVRPENAKTLQEAKVCVMDNEACAKKWAEKFRSIITQYMICTKDVMKRLSELCDKRYANCTDVDRRRHQAAQASNVEIPSDVDSNSISIDMGRHLKDPDDYTARRTSSLGGFCENDHGGPLIVKFEGKERAIGVISACKIDPKSHSCHGPFLYTSVFKNRQFISCAIQKDVAEENCRRVFRSGITHEEYSVDWSDVKDDERSDDVDVKASDSSSGEEPKYRGNNNSNKHIRSRDDVDEEGKGVDNSKKDIPEKPKEKVKKAKQGVKTGKDIIYDSSKEENVNEPEE